MKRRKHLGRKRKDPLREFMREIAKRREAGTLGPEVDEEIMLRALERARRVVAAEEAAKEKGLA